MNFSLAKRPAHKSNGRSPLELSPTPAAISLSEVLQSSDALSCGDDLDVRDIANDFKHGNLRLRAAGQEMIADAGWVEAPLVFLADLHCLSLPLCEVRPDLRLVTEIVRDHRVNIRQDERGVLLDDFLRGRTGVQGGNHGVEGHAGATHMDQAIGVATDRNPFRRNAQFHKASVEGLEASCQSFPFEPSTVRAGVPKRDRDFDSEPQTGRGCSER